MLKGIDPVLSPDLLKTLCEMGHGDEIVFCDAHFPAAQLARAAGACLLRADGVDIPRLLKGLAPLFDLDKYAIPVIMMSAEPGDDLNPSVEDADRAALGYTGDVLRLTREQFYDRVRTAYAFVATGDVSQYGNVILKKGNQT